MSTPSLEFLVTANRLDDGRVVYRTAAQAWSERYEDAQATQDPAERDAWLAWARSQEHVVAGPYAIEAPIGPHGRVLSARERLRAAGPGDARRRLGYPA